MNKREQLNAKLLAGSQVFLLDEIDEVAYDFTNYPTLRVKAKGGKIIERKYAGEPSEFRAVSALVEMTAEEFERF